MKHILRAALILCFLAGLIPVAISAQSSCSAGGTQAPVELAVPNLTGQHVNVYWLDFNCVEQPTGSMKANEIFYQSTYDGHEWIFRADSGQEISRFVTSSSAPTVLLGAGSFNAQAITTNCSRVTPAQANQGATLEVINNSNDPALLFWIDDQCVEWLYWVVPAHDSVMQNAWLGHDWVARWADGRTIEHRTLAATPNTIVIDPPPQAATATPAAVAAAATATPAAALPVKATPAAAAGPTFPVTESGCEVTSVTPAMGLDPFYTKYCDYNGLRILGTVNAPDAALEQAWLITANMLFARPDIVQSLVNFGFFVSVVGENELLGSVPEFAYLANDPAVNINNLRAYSKLLEEPRLIAIGAENLLCAPTDVNPGENLFVGRLGSITRFALVRDLQPNHSDLLTPVRQHAVDNGLWAEAWITESNGTYWDNGVQAYFNSAPGALLPGPADAAINTRQELMAADPQLYDMINAAFGAEDWTPVCPAA